MEAWVQIPLLTMLLHRKCCCSFSLNKRPFGRTVFGKSLKISKKHTEENPLAVLFCGKSTQTFFDSLALLVACCFVAASVNTTQQQQLVVISAIVCFPSCVKLLPRVRLELTTFRLWDWRAAYCANEATHNIFMQAKKWVLRYYTNYIIVALCMTPGQMPLENGQTNSDLNLPAGQGELAQMVERSLSMREVAGSMPAFSKEPTFLALNRPRINDSGYCL